MVVSSPRSCPMVHRKTCMESTNDFQQDVVYVSKIKVKRHSQAYHSLLNDIKQYRRNDWYSNIFKTIGYLTGTMTTLFDQLIKRYLNFSFITIQLCSLYEQNLCAFSCNCSSIDMLVISLCKLELSNLHNTAQQLIKKSYHHPQSNFQCLYQVSVPAISPVLLDNI